MSISIPIAVSLVDDVTLVRVLTTTLDARNSKAFRSAVEEAVGGGSRVVIDLGGVEFMDSSGLGTLIPMLRTYSERGGDLRLAALPPKLQVLFEVTRLYKVFSIWPDQESAVKSFQS